MSGGKQGKNWVSSSFCLFWLRARLGFHIPLPLLVTSLLWQSIWSSLVVQPTLVLGIDAARLLGKTSRKTRDKKNKKWPLLGAFPKKYLSPPMKSENWVGVSTKVIFTLCIFTCFTICKHKNKKCGNISFLMCGNIIFYTSDPPLCGEYLIFFLSHPLDKVRHSFIRKR